MIYVYAKYIFSLPVSSYFFSAPFYIVSGNLRFTMYIKLMEEEGDEICRSGGKVASPSVSNRTGI